MSLGTILTYLQLTTIFAVPLAVSSEEPPVFVDQALSPGSLGCADIEPKCSVWASQGECQTNAAWMMSNCRRSCQSCQGGEQAWQLRLTIASNYDNTSGVKNFSINRVKLNSFHIEHIELDETKQMAKIHGKLVLTWNDSRVAWDKNKWHVSWLNFYWVQIWTPQIVQSNAKCAWPPSYPSQISSKVLAANYTGQVYMWADFSLITLCDMDYSRYPYDIQKYYFKLDDHRYYMVRFSVADSAKAEAQISAKKIHPAGWKTSTAELIQNKYSVDVLSDWALDPFNVETSNVDVFLTLKRDPSYYGAQIAGPIIISVVVTLVSFLTGNFFNQIALLLISLCLQVLAAYTIGQQLPPASGETPAILKFSSFNMAITCILLIVSALLLTLCNLESSLPPPRFLSKFIEVAQKLAPCIGVQLDDTKFGQDGATVVDNPAPIKRNRAPVARAIKWTLFLLSLVLYFFVMLTCLAA